MPGYYDGRYWTLEAAYVRVQQSCADSERNSQVQEDIPQVQQSYVKVHVIDLGVRTGMHWTILIQALASRYENPVEFLKITAVGKSEQPANMEATGQRLLSFADAMKLNFSFTVIVLSDMKEFKEDLFMLEADEAVVVHSPVLLRILLPWPDCLEALLAAISRLKPCVMVVTEMEGNYNSSFFDHRFAEARFFYSALLDCIEASRNENNEVIMDALEANFGTSIINIVATEGEERTTRVCGAECLEIVLCAIWDG